MSVEVKTCARCGESLPVSAFGRNAKLKSGLKSWCRSCCAAYNRAWRSENEEHGRIYNARRRVRRPDLTCFECKGPFVGRTGQVVCSRRCADARYRRLHPVQYAAKQARAFQRRRARRVDGGAA